MTTTPGSRTRAAPLQGGARVIGQAHGERVSSYVLPRRARIGRRSARAGARAMRQRGLAQSTGSRRRASQLRSVSSASRAIEEVEIEARECRMVGHHGVILRSGKLCSHRINGIYAGARRISLAMRPRSCGLYRRIAKTLCAFSAQRADTGSHSTALPPKARRQRRQKGWPMAPQRRVTRIAGLLVSPSPPLSPSRLLGLERGGLRGRRRIVHLHVRHLQQPREPVRDARQGVHGGEPRVTITSNPTPNDKYARPSARSCRRERLRRDHHRARRG